VNFVFVDSVSQQKVKPSSVSVVKNGIDTLRIDSTAASLLEYTPEDQNFWVLGGVGAYEIIVRDPVYGDFSVDSIAVEQNPNYTGCGSIPLTEHLRIGVTRLAKRSHLPKANRQGQFVILDEFGEGSCR
jgi:hypothetical protein